MVAKVEWHQGELFPRVGFIVTNLRRRAKRVVKFYNGRGTAEQWIKEGKNAVKWTRLSCHDFVDNQVRLQLFALAYNLGNFLRRLALPRAVKHWSLTTLREKLIKIGAKVVRHARYVMFQMAEVAIPRRLFRAILERIRRFAAISAEGSADMTSVNHIPPNERRGDGAVGVGRLLKNGVGASLRCSNLSVIRIFGFICLGIAWSDTSTGGYIGSSVAWRRSRARPYGKCRLFYLHTTATSFIQPSN